MCKSHRFVYCNLCLRRENYTLFASVCQQSDTSTDNIRNAERYGRRKRNMHVLLNTTKPYKKCVYKYRKRHYKRIFKKIIIVFTFIFLQNENLNNKKNLLFAVFCIEKNIFPRFVFDFMHGSLPLHTGVGKGFLLQMFASGNGQTRRINNTLHIPFDKNLYCKIVFTCFAKATKLHFSFLTVKPAENLNVGNETCNACTESVLPANVKEIFVRSKIAHPTVCRTNTLFAV